MAGSTDTMYSKCTGSEISLWCDVSQVGSTGGRKKNSEPGGSKRKEREDAVQDIYEELLEEHVDKYSTPQLRLWARMINCGTHDDYTEPPRVPLITGTAPKRRKTSDMSDAVTDAAKAVAKAFSPPPPPSPPHSNSPPNPGVSVPIGVSPGKTIELRSKNLEQLRYIQQLYEDSILSSTEYEEQKQFILNAIRKLQ